MATDQKQMLDSLFHRIETEVKTAPTSELAALIDAVANLAAVIGLDETMDMKEVAPILGVGERRAYEIANDPNFPTLQIGTSKRVSRVAFFRWIQQRQVVLA